MSVEQDSEQPYLCRGTRAFRRVNVAFFAAGLATFAVLYTVQPLLPAFTGQFHVTPTAASFALSVSTLVLAVALPLVGLGSDAVGRKGVMVASLMLSAAGCLATAFCPNFGSLLAVRALEGVFVAGIPGVAMAYLSEEVEPRSLGFAMGLYISGNSVGGLFGRVVVSAITDVSSWRIAVSVVALCSFAAGLYFWRNLPPSRNFARQAVHWHTFFSGFAAHLRDPALVCLFFIGALLMGGFVSVYNYISFRLLDPPYHLSETLVGSIFLVYLVGTFSSSWIGKLADQIGRRRVLWLNIAIMGGGCALTLVRPLWAIVTGVAVVTFGFFGGHSTASSWVGRRATQARGQASSLYLFCYYAGSSIGGSAGGVFWSADGWLGVVGMVEGCLAVALVLSWMLARIHNVASR
ncbi:MAG: MFS transporter [Alicyclobacillus sp.]|nr:MFS transporter [Alicyclobacillus sp.]